MQLIVQQFLKNGIVLITGGHTGRKAELKIYSSGEIYDPVSFLIKLVKNKFGGVTNLPAGRYILSFFFANQLHFQPLYRRAIE